MTTTEAKFLRTTEQPLERTLIDIVRATARRFPEAEAIDDGEVVVTYAELINEIDSTATWLYEQGIRRGDRIGVRMPSGSRELYLAILSIMAAGAAYVPVDADDPDERAEMVFDEAGIAGYFDAEGLHLAGSTARNRPRPLDSDADSDEEETEPTPPSAREIISQEPTPDDDCWIIFTSGSTGKPKGVAVTHRSAAAFVDAEARWFLANHPEGPLGPDDRVLAGLSVAFDASCEEMWLAWRNGACLVPAPRSLVRSGVDLGPWLISRHITAVSTVPTLAGLWPAEALDSVRLLIIGGEACPQELVERLSTPEREMWNTYGPTEATVVASGIELKPGKPVTIGFPLDGWDLTVIDEEGNPVLPGTKGELVIGGVGLARYLDPEKDAEKYAPLPALGWERAYRTGDHVIMDEDGLYFTGRVDDQVKIGGRRIELGEVEAHLAALPGATQATVVVQKTGAGDSILVGYVGAGGDAAAMDYDKCMDTLRDAMPAAMVPRLHIMDELPVRTSGKVDKAALPWPLPARAGEGDVDKLNPVEKWLSDIWADVLSVPAPGAASDFFALGGTSLAAASVIARIRQRAPQVAVRDLYDHPRLGNLAEELVARGFISDDMLADDASDPTAHLEKVPEPTPVSRKTRWAQVGLMVPLQWARGMRWVTWLAIINWVIGGPLALPGWLVAVLAVLFLTPLGVMPINAATTRLLTRNIAPGDYPRGGSVHLCLWAAERLAESSGAHSVAGAPFVLWYARMLGARIGKGVNLHALPPVTGLVKLDDYCSIEPEVDLSGYWVDGDVVHVGEVTIGKHARIGARSTLLPGARIGNDAHIEAGSTVTGEKKVKAGARWSGSPARKVGRSKHRFPEEVPPARRHWVAIYGLTAVLLTLVPLSAAVAMAAVIGWGTGLIDGTTELTTSNLWPTLGSAVLWAIPATFVGVAVYALLTLILVRLFSIGLKPGVFPVRSRVGWQSWATIRLMDAARHDLFFIYASMLTPLWLRALGAQIGHDSEVSTAIGIPKFLHVKDESFLADDTMVGSYELGGGWLLVGDSRIGKRAFLGNSGITLPERKLAKNSLVAVLSSTPKKTKSGSNWWGSPPERMRRVGTVSSDESAQTYRPTTGLKVARSIVETLRVLAPMVSLMLATITLFSLQGIGMFTAELVTAGGVGAALLGLVVAWLLSPAVLLIIGALGLLITVVAKWVCVGKHKPGDHPLWSKFVWLNELQDTFVEMVAAPWYLNPAMATGGIARAMRLLGANVGHGVWLETYWLPETDLITIERGASVGRGCVVQTHLFTDRVMTLDTVHIGHGSVLGPHSVALPASVLDDGCRVEPGSLVMRGDHVPAHTSWRGNPIEPVVAKKK
ncbi:amino acid adenylation protein [Corynebacterium sp. HMSC074C04]|uniref:Pls/PosA family non-ribosomal peptide synthetase n=1 Tax=Corynebacterium sp. HMSC074C04 TaxID=1739514 RepID=UPI0008A9DC5C|nr:Pls/PosA family non-ribosomal peptide synthetase [Corynebacterium sp. HMSC074C04]OHR39412.1 amino acid adenylation protein [Corynebacterium sp. HMSC074C04]